jgi:glycine/D-amino acid oxidase-like deaminating enzyme
MILRASELAASDVFQSDVCIVGAGPAGITLACELLGSGLSILILEAGEQAFAKRAQDGLFGEVALRSPHSPPHMYRRRVLGGASSIWGGRCVPLDPIVLQERSYVSGSGWPLSWQELERYYHRAHPYFDAGPYDYSACSTLVPGAPETLMGLACPDILADNIERFSPPTDFGKRYRRLLADALDLKLLLGVEALRLDAPEVSVRELHAIAGDKKIKIRAERYVLATGGLETRRLLILSDLTRRDGLGNEGGAVGRYYMCHLENTIGRLQLIPKERPIALHFERSLDGVYVRRKLALSAEAQRREQLLNTAFRFHYPPISDPSHGTGILSALYLMKDAVLPEYRQKLATIEMAARNRLDRNPAFWLAHGANIIRDAPAVASFCAKWLRLRILAKRKLPFVVVANRDGRYPLDINAEQVPNWNSRVLLAERRDRYGRPVLKVDWRASRQDEESLLRTLGLLQRCFTASGVARLEYDEDRLQEVVTASTPVAGHHIGTARMADNPRHGVVDANGTVHGVANLYCVGSATFPTCGHANPTLTIVAMAVRLADHLKTAFQRRSANAVVREAEAGQ